MNHYAAGIVLYHPNVDRLKENLDAVSSQVEIVYCYDNGMGDDQRVTMLLSSYDNVVVLGEGENQGISIALNAVLKQAGSDGVEWILTLDQDSVVCENMIERLAELKNEKDVAIICPQVEDVRRKSEDAAIVSNTHEDIDFCITSGSFMNVERTIQAGGYDDYLFIGLVDNEICYRLRRIGYRIIRNNAVILDHQLGNLTPSKHEQFYLKLGSALHSETIKKLSYKRVVSPMRLYFATRNMVYLQRKYSDDFVAAWSKKMVVTNSISNLLRGEHKVKLIKSVILGIRDGKRSCRQA